MYSRELSMGTLATLGHILYDVRCYVDDFPMPDRTTFTNGKVMYGAGGSACNVAVAAQRLGVDAALCGRIGFDNEGRFIINRLLEETVDTAYIQICYTAPTGMSVIIINHEGTPEIVEMLGANEPILPEDIKEGLFADVRWLHMTGTNIEAVDYASACAAERRCMISFDPGRAMSRRGYEALLPILRRVDYLIINRIEAAQLAGTRDEMDVQGAVDILSEALDHRTTFIIKGGKYPIYVRSQNEHFFLEPANVPVVDTIGAGDSFVGGLLATLIDSQPLEASVRRAACNAALKVQREGAQSAPRRDELDAYVAEHGGALRITHI